MPFLSTTTVLRCGSHAAFASTTFFRKCVLTCSLWQICYILKGNLVLPHCPQHCNSHIRNESAPYKQTHPYIYIYMYIMVKKT